MSHSDLIQALKENTWDPSTLYRNLTDLAEVGLLRRSEFGDRTWRFEVSCDHGHGDHAAHFLCRDCGEIVCLPEVTVTPSGDETMPRAVLSGAVEVQILGQCDSCFTPAA